MSDELDLDTGSALATRLRRLTPARVGLARTGVSLATRELLDFERCRAQARDAVQGRLEAAALAGALAQMTKTLFAGTEVLRLHSAAPDRATYMQRPDLGRRLDQPSRELLAAKPAAEDVQESIAIIVVDGLSALAVERHALPLIAELLPRLEAFRLAPICVVEQGRVAIGDAIGQALHAALAVVLIGERPGLSSPDSLGVYITWEPRSGKKDAERNCISNIREEGLGYSPAASRLYFYMQEATRRKLTGVGLKDPAEGLAGLL